MYDINSYYTKHLNYTLERLRHTHFYAVCALPQLNTPTTLTQLTRRRMMVTLLDALVAKHWTLQISAWCDSYFCQFRRHERFHVNYSYTNQCNCRQMNVKHQQTGRPSPLPVTQILLKLNQDITGSFPEAYNDRHVTIQHQTNAGNCTILLTESLLSCGQRNVQINNTNLTGITV